MENRVFRGGQAAVASIDVAGEASDALLADLREIPHVLGVSEVTLRRRTPSAGRETSSVPFPRGSSVRSGPGALVTAMTEPPEETGDNRGQRSRSIPRRTTSRRPRSTSTVRAARRPAHTGVVCEVAMPGLRGRAGARARGGAGPAGRGLVRHHATSDRPAGPRGAAPPRRPGVHADARRDLPDAADPRLRRPSGLQQTVWRVAEGPATAAWPTELAAADHYIADGHHRVAAALEEWRLGRQARGRRPALRRPPDGRPATVGIPPAGDGPVDPGGPHRPAGPWFRVRAASGRLRHRRPDRSGCTSGAAGSTSGVREAPRRRPCGPRRRASSRSGSSNRLTADSGPARLTVEIAPARTSVDELTRRCDADGGALFTLAPPPLEALTRLADAGEVMPPKTTYFEPKPCAGIFLRP